MDFTLTTDTTHTLREIEIQYRSCTEPDFPNEFNYILVTITEYYD